MTYTTFKYGAVTLSSKELTRKGSITVSCDVTNTGTTDALEVPQLYVRDMVATLARPIRELKGFQKVLIPAGQTKTISFTISAKDLLYCHKNMTMDVEPGDFSVWIAPDATQGEPVTFTLVD